MKNRISDLLTPSERLEKLREITPSLVAEIGLKLPEGERFYYGQPLYASYGMTRNQASYHRNARLLLTKGCDLEFKSARR